MQILNNNELKAKCAVLERRAPETEMHAHAYCHGIHLQHSRHIVIIEKNTNTIFCHHYFDMLEYNNNIIDVGSIRLVRISY